MVRFKNRWLLVEFIPCNTQNIAPPKEELNAKLVWLALKQSVLNNFGEVGWGAVSTSLNVKYFSPTTNLCIIRVARDHHRIAWGATTLLTSINDINHIPHVIHLAGTVKQAQLAAIKHDREIIARFRVHASKQGRIGVPIEMVFAHTHSNIFDQGPFDKYLEQSTKEIEAMQD